jgi:hypothetical protein
VLSRCHNGACRACGAAACCGHFRKRPQHTCLTIAFESPKRMGRLLLVSIRSAVQCTSVQCHHPEPRWVAYSTWVQESTSTGGALAPAVGRAHCQWACVLSGNLSHDPDSKQQSPPMATSATGSQGPTSVNNKRQSRGVAALELDSTVPSDSPT